MKKYLSKPKVRKPHHQHQRHQQHDPPPAAINPKRTKGIVTVAVIIFALLGVGITFFAVGDNIIWLIVVGILGACCGYLFGNQIVKGLSKK